MDITRTDTISLYSVLVALGPLLAERILLAAVDDADVDDAVLARRLHDRLQLRRVLRRQLVLVVIDLTRTEGTTAEAEAEAEADTDTGGWTDDGWMDGWKSAMDG